MERLIDADALIGDVRDRYCKNCVKRKGIKNGKCRFIYEIGEAPCRACDVEDMIYELENAPTAESVKHGHWIREPNCWYRCSECGSHYPSIADNMNYHYCPDCGAKMTLD